MAASKILGQQARDLWIDLAVLQVGDRSIEMVAESLRKRVLAQGALVHKDSAQHGESRPLGGQRTLKLVLCYQTFGNEDLTETATDRGDLAFRGRYYTGAGGHIRSLNVADF
jgi:hypothetical protein